MGTVDDNDGEILLFGLRIPPHHWLGYMGRGQGARSRSATWGRCKPPRFSSPRTRIGVVGRRVEVPPALLDLFPTQPRRRAAASRIRSPFVPVLRPFRRRTTWTLSTRHSGDIGFQTFTQSAPRPVMGHVPRSHRPHPTPQSKSHLRGAQGHR